MCGAQHADREIAVKEPTCCLCLVHIALPKLIGEMLVVVADGAPVASVDEGGLEPV
jgi:hypothetical protein